jgi:DNA-directed RNA polymerase I, II, and III subunit RPABC2
MSKKSRRVKDRAKKTGTPKAKNVAAEKKTSPYMSIYEYTALISARASVISNSGGTPMIEGFDPIIIARQEVDKGLVTLMIRRSLPDGTYEDWRPSEMIPPRY